MKIYPYIFILSITILIACQKEEGAISTTFDRSISRTLFNQNEVRLYDFVTTDDQSIVVAYNGMDSLDMLDDGIIDSTIIYVQKINNFGEMIWTKKYPTGKPSKVFDIIHAMDGGFFLLGSFNIHVDQTAFDKSILLFKLDSAGELIWQKKIGTGMHGQGYEMVERSNGNIAVIGIKTFLELREFDQEGNLISRNFIPNEIRDYSKPSGLCLGNDETIVVCGNGMIAYQEGLPIWEFEYSKDDPDFRSGISSVCSIEEAQGGGYLGFGYRVALRADPSYQHIDHLLVRVDNNGNVLWEKTFDGSDQDFGYDINPTVDGNFIAIGKTSVFGPGKGYIPIYKFDVEGNILSSKQITGAAEYTAMEPSSVRQIDENHVVLMYVESKLWDPQNISEIKISKVEMD